MILKNGRIKTLIILILTIGLLGSLCTGGFSKEKPLKKGKIEKVPVFGQEFSGPQYVPGQILVKFKPTTTRNQVLFLTKKFNVNVVKKYSFPNGLEIYLMRLPEKIQVEEMVARLKEEALVEYAEPDFIVHVWGEPTTQNTPNDPYFNDLWGLHNTGQTGGTSDADIDAPEAWDICNGSNEIVIADIDTGIDINHPDLAANIWTNPGEIPGNGIDDDGNGYIDDIHGWDFVNEDNTVYDGIDDHGTHTAGTIGAVGNNGIGVCGVNWKVKIMCLKFLEYGSGSTSDAIEAFSYVAKMGVKITSNSWGGVGSPSQALMDAMAACDALHICAAGNSSMDNDAGYPGYSNYPSSFPLDNIIAVAATDHNDQLASFSNWGATTVDLAAPGVNIKSTVPTDRYDPPYKSFSGTSMATPHVAGVAGLLMAEYPDKSILEIKQMILGSVDFKENLQGVVLTGGRLNAYSALSGLLAPIIDEVSATPTVGSAPLTVHFTGAAHDPDGTIVEHYWDFGDGEVSNEWNPTHTYQEGGAYTATFFVTDNDGRTSSRSITIRVISPADVLLIDDDGGYSFETYLTNALANCGISYQLWDVSVAGEVPPLTDLSSLYKVVIWNLSYTWENTLTSADQENIISYLNSGGRLFLCGQDLIYDIGKNSFVQNYLHVTSVWQDLGASKAVGIEGDPITNGLNITLNYPFIDYSDKIVPDSSAIGIFKNNSGNFIALRYAGNYRLVFFAFPFEAIPSDASAPNNAATVIQRIYNWLTEDLSPPPPNSSPALSWTGEAGYESDGLEPETGTTQDSFVYRVKYTDSDNNPPYPGYPKVHILKDGEEIEGSPFTMNEVDSQDTDYTDGKLYTFTKQGLVAGSDYTYFFEAKDSQGASATGDPTSPRSGPVVEEIPGLTLISPNGGEVWVVGSTHSITWSSQGNVGDNVKLEYSTNGGVSWQTIVSSTPNDGSYSWQVPNTSSTNCLVKVSSLPGGTYFDVSDGEFTIVASGTPATATRVISVEEVKPGATFEVTVTITCNQDIAGLGLDENLVGFSGDWSPWQVTPIENDGAIFNASEVQWVWLQVNAGETKTVRYMVTVPSDLPGEFQIEGAITSHSPEFEEEVQGDSEIEVPALYISRDISPNSISVGNEFYVNIQFEALIDIHNLVVDEDLVGFPPDWSPWQVNPVDSAGAQFDPENVKWVWSEVSAGETKTLKYKVIVPQGIDSGTYQIQGTVTGTGSPQFAYPIPGDSIIEVDENQPPIAQFSYTASSDGPHTDEVITFTDESYDPDGEIVEWLWEFGDGEISTEENPTHTYVYSPSSPVYSSNPDDVLRSFDVTLTITDNNGANSSFSDNILVYLTPSRVVANYYTADDLFDLDEILQAVAWWCSQEEVPLTNGRVIDLDTLLDMIARWSTGTPVGSSLITSPEENSLIVVREISRTRVYPGETFQVTLYLTLNKDITGLGLDEGLSGFSGAWGDWQVIPVDNEDAVFNSQNVQWFWLDLKKGNTRSITYQVKVPENALPGKYSIEGIVLSHLPEVSLQVEGDSTIIVASEGSSPLVYPNPCPDSGEIVFSQVTEGSSIQIYTLTGEKIVTLQVPTGESEVHWDLRNEGGEKVERGIYIYIIMSDGGRKYSGKIAIIK